MATTKKEINEQRLISVVIPTYKRPGLALKSAKKIRQLHADIEIIIVDQQNSSNISKKEATELNIQYLNIPIPNTALAKNVGIKQAKGDIIFFFDDDVEITQNTIPEQLKAYADPQVIGTAGHVINDGEVVPKNTVVETGKTNSLATKFSFNFWSTKEQYVDFPYGCNMSFRKKTLDALKGFDETFSQAFEEIDLATRALQYGRIQFVPKGLVYHHRAKSGGTRHIEDNQFKKNYYYYGMYIAKHVPFPNVLISLLLRSRSAFSESLLSFISLWNGFFSYKVKL